VTASSANTFCNFILMWNHSSCNPRLLAADSVNSGHPWICHTVTVVKRLKDKPADRAASQQTI